MQTILDYHLFPHGEELRIVEQIGLSDNDNSSCRSSSSSSFDEYQDDEYDRFHAHEEGGDGLGPVAWIAILRNQVLLTDVGEELGEGGDDDGDAELVCDAAEAVLAMEPALGWDSVVYGNWKGLRFHVYDRTEATDEDDGVDNHEGDDHPLTVWSHCAVFNTNMISTAQAQKFVQDHMVLPTEALLREATTKDCAWKALDDNPHQISHPHAQLAQLLQESLVEMADQVNATSVFDQDVDLTLCHNILARNRRLVLGQIHSLERALDTLNEMNDEDDSGSSDEEEDDEDEGSYSHDEEDDSLCSEGGEEQFEEIACDDDHVAMEAFLAISSRRSVPITSARRNKKWEDACHDATSTEATEQSEFSSSSGMNFSDEDEGQTNSIGNPLKQRPSLLSPNDVQHFYDYDDDDDDDALSTKMELFPPHTDEIKSTCFLCRVFPPLASSFQ
jgi:hypothetical protein